MLKRSCLPLILGLPLAGCGSTTRSSVIERTETRSPLAKTEPVQIFKWPPFPEHYEKIAKIRADYYAGHWSCSENISPAPSMDEALPKLENRARSLGANAVFVEKMDRSGCHVEIEALAVSLQPK